MGKKPRLDRFAGCRVLPDRQGKALSATYRVSGRDAKQVAAFLARAFGVRPLERVCCIWETPTTHFKDDGSVVYSIVMGSDETLVQSGAERHVIPACEIVVERYTGDV